MSAVIMQLVFTIISSSVVPSIALKSIKWPQDGIQWTNRTSNCGGAEGCSNNGSGQGSDVGLPSALTLRDDVWAVPLLAISAVNVAMLVVFDLYVAIMTFRTSPNRRHLFLGQTLLFGLFLSSSLGFVFALEPHHPVTCAVVRLGLGVSYAVVFVTLLVKLVFLISLNSGVYLPANYQSLLICFGVGVQLAIGIQWLVHQPPLVTAAVTSSPSSCRVRLDEMVLSLVYDMLLLITLTVLAVKYRTITDNHREATYIGVSVGATVVLWTGWLIAASVLHEGSLRDACVAYAVVLNATLTFLVMFLPKSRQLAAMGQQQLYVDDRGSRLSADRSLDPSFFHITPMTNPLKQPEKVKPAVYDRMMYGGGAMAGSSGVVPGRMLRYGYYQPTPVYGCADYYTGTAAPTADQLYYHQQQLDRSSRHMTSVNPNVHFYRSRPY